MAGKLVRKLETGSFEKKCAFWPMADGVSSNLYPETTTDSRVILHALQKGMDNNSVKRKNADDSENNGAQFNISLPKRQRQSSQSDIEEIKLEDFHLRVPSDKIDLLRDQFGKYIISDEETTPKRSTPKSQRTPRQLLKQEEIEKKRREIEERKEQKRREEEERKEQKRREEDERKEQKRRQEEERKEQKRREEEERREKKRREEEEQERKEQKRREEEERKEQKRREEEERKEQKRREEDEKRRQQELEESKKRRQSQMFMNFFQKLDKPATPRTLASMPSSLFKEFEIKQNMEVAPIHYRDPLTSKQYDSLLKHEEKDIAECLAEIKQNKRRNSLSRKPDVIEVDRRKWKLFQIHTNYRPPYYGTWRKRSTHITGRRPFSTAEPSLNYEYDSDDDWEDEPSDAEECKSDDEDATEKDEELDESENEFFVEHGYLSSDEGSEDAEKRKKRLSKRAEEFKVWQQQKEKRTKKREGIHPIIYGPCWKTERSVQENVPFSALQNLKAGVIFDYSSIDIPVN
ncbi:chromatin assembly factor 1 subunit A domain-containing protein [Ditylenchus destructor]|uniref:Chromatin assembly factor 1 subunit A domain-containing protein n=1 Tax=Ditylenchus destructor TaxID=166010 RepID=A0AAD4MZQ5_9BILA|nr:chromatin assembly factor 1 subunit A domain-containing protein [Ditylenchus destructor]